MLNFFQDVSKNIFFSDKKNKKNVTKGRTENRHLEELRKKAEVVQCGLRRKPSQ